MNVKKQSQARIIIKNYFYIMLITTLITIITTCGVVSFLLVKNSESESIKMINSLQTTFVHQHPNYDAWSATSKQGPAQSYVRIKILNHNDQGTSYFNSHGTNKFLKESKIVIKPFNAVRWVREYGLFYYRTRVTDKAVYQTWVSINDILHIGLLTLISVVIAASLSLMIGIVLIQIFAKKLSDPLKVLTISAQQRSNQLNKLQTPLPEPNSPSEVHQLAGSFNQLLNSLNEQLRREQRFVSDASHELRTPLSVIRGHVSLLRRRYKQHPEIIEKSVRFLDSESLRMQHLIEELLRITRNEHANIQLGTVNLSDLIVEITSEYEKALNHPLKVQVPNDVYVNSNYDYLKQIMVALIDNAAKYSDANELIMTKVSTDGNDVLISVIDNGIGISDEDKEHIFERFYRVDDSRSKVNGTGLGLSIVAQLVNLIHAKIEVNDHQPNGTVFTLTVKRFQK